MIKNKEKFDKVIKKVVDKINLEIPVNEDIKNEILILDEYFYEKAGFIWQGVSASTHGGVKWNDMLLRFRKGE